MAPTAKNSLGKRNSSSESDISEGPAPSKRSPGARTNSKKVSRKRVTFTAKKERKRDQNKSAALRYRLKKKEEKMESEVQLQELEERNEGLRQTLQGLEAEISYLKRLWSEVDQAKRGKCQ